MNVSNHYKGLKSIDWCSRIDHNMKRIIIDNITVDPNIRFGKPVIAGTRVPVDLIVGKIAGGMAIDEVAREYDLTREQVLAAVGYAAEIVASEEVSFV